MDKEQFLLVWPKILYRSLSDLSDLLLRVVVYSVNKPTRSRYIINSKPIMPCRVGAKEVALPLKAIIICMKLFYQETFDEIE